MATQHAGSVSLTRDQTQIPCSGSVEPYLLDLQGSPKKYFLKRPTSPQKQGIPLRREKTDPVPSPPTKDCLHYHFPAFFLTSLNLWNIVYTERCAWNIPTLRSNYKVNSLVTTPSHHDPLNPNLLSPSPRWYLTFIQGYHFLASLPSFHISCIYITKQLVLGCLCFDLPNCLSGSLPFPRVFQSILGTLGFPLPNLQPRNTRERCRPYYIVTMTLGGLAVIKTRIMPLSGVFPPSWAFCWALSPNVSLTLPAIPQGGVGTS